MSKTTKIVAALGIVAGLGVAALPAFTYATTEASVTGDVEVIVEVEPAIAMTITGNNDGDVTDTDHTDMGVWTAVASPTGNPSEMGYYELDGHVYSRSTDTTVDSEKTYYTLVIPDYAEVDNYAPSDLRDYTQTLDGYTLPATAVAGTSSSIASLMPNSNVLGVHDTREGFSSTITVYTNSTTGYTLAVRDKDSNTDLTHTSGQYYIPASNSAVVPGTSAWNYDVTTTDATPVVTEHQAITASDVSIDSLDTKTTNGRVTYVDYNVSTAADQATGYYTDTIVYTATTR